MSSLATAPARAASWPGRATAWTRAGGRATTIDWGLGTGLAAGFVLVAFLTTGGTNLAPNTWVEIAITVIGTALAASLVVVRPRGRVWGLTSAVMFLALTVLTVASISWSVQPANSWLAANQTVSYLAAFGGAIALARIVPARWRALVGAVALAASVICCFALLVKVFPGALDPSDPLGRLRAPFDYWNATGLIAAMGLPACLWVGARRDRGRFSRALSVPAVGVLVSVLVLSYSRGAVAAAVIGVGCWFALVPLRLRGTVVLALGSAGAALITAWAVATGPITQNHASLHARITAGHGFGLVVLFVLALQTVCGLTAAFAMDRANVPTQIRRRVGAMLVVIVALVPFGGLAGLAASSRGFSGEVSHIWNTLTNPRTGAANTPDRLVELANSRPRYWSEGLKVGEHSLLAGSGALGYGTARTRYSTDQLVALHAHSYVIETFADFGLIGIAVSLGLLVAWALAAARTLATPSPRDASYAAEDIGLLTLLAVVIAFGVHSTIDWTWFVPGTAIPALVCAGWLAGRGPLGEPARRSVHPRGLRERPGAMAAILAIGALTVAVCWAIWQPLRSADADAAAISALGHGDVKGAVDDGGAAGQIDPVDVNPLFDLSAIYSGTGNARAAHAELVKAISIQPSNPATWEQLGEYLLDHGHPRGALGVLHNALRLDRGSKDTRQMIAAAQAQLAVSRTR